MTMEVHGKSCNVQIFNTFLVGFHLHEAFAAVLRNTHWYECPNGHPYFIGNCGGANQTARCNECGEEIGGSSHRLLSSNRHVTGRVREVLQNL